MMLKIFKRFSYAIFHFKGSCQVTFDVCCARRSRSAKGANRWTDGSNKPARGGEHNTEGNCITRNIGAADRVVYGAKAGA